MADETKDAAVHVIAAAAFGEGMAGVTVETRHNLATHHLWTARSAAKRCRELEAELVAKGTVNAHIEHRTLSITSVVFSVFFLEALVNQLFSDAEDSKPGKLTFFAEGLTDAQAGKLGLWWRKTDGHGRPVNELKPVLKKYQTALDLLGRPRMPETTDPYLSAYDLIQLRNALVHFKPEWQGQSAHPIEQMLKSHAGFVENQQKIGSPWYPNKCFGAGCAAWACKVVMDYADDWLMRMGLTRGYRSDFQGWPAV